MRMAFKEWAVIVDALGHGQQILILRKGGISEGRGGFQVNHPDFFLFPTLFHQQPDSVLPEAATRFREILPLYEAKETVRIEYFVRVTTWAKLTSLNDAERLKGQHVWKDEVIASRYDWGGEKSIFALACRVYRLPAPILLPNSPAYAGCKSWIELESDIDVAGSIPVLSDAAFGEKLAEFEQAAGLTNIRA